MPQSAIPPGRHAPVRTVWLDKRKEETIEEVGEKLRAMMPWIEQNRLVDRSKN